MLQLNNQKRKDINFFTIHKKKQSIALMGILLALIPIMLVGAMFSVYTYNRYEINQLNQRYEKAERDLKSINLEEKQPVLEKAQVKRDIYSTYFAWVDSLNTQLGSFKIVPSELINNINEKGKGIVECVSIEAKENSLTYVGTSDTMSNIADFQRNCTEISNMSNIFVHSIIKKEEEITVNGAKVKTGKYIYEFNMTSDFTK